MVGSIIAIFFFFHMSLFGIDINDIDFSPDGKIIASISIHGNLCMWDVATGNKIKQIKVKDKYALSLCFSPDGKLLASGYDDGNIYLWDPFTGREVKKIYGTSLPIISVCFSPNGKFITCVSRSHVIRLWEVTTGKENKVFEKSCNEICSIAFSRDSRIIAAGYNDGTIGLWDVRSGKEINRLYEHTGVVYTVCFNNDDRTIASGARDETIRLWDVESRKEIKAMDGHSGRIYSISFSPNGRTIASGSEDGSVHLWDVDLGKEILSMEHTGRVYSVKFNPTGKMLASGSGDGTIRFWDFVSGKEILRIEGFETKNTEFKTQKNSGKLAILMKPDYLQTSDGEISNFSIKVKNSGTGDLYFVRIVEDIDLNQKSPLIFHPSTPLEKLAINEIVEIPCKVSALSGYTNPVDQTSVLHLKVIAANNSTIPVNIPVKLDVPRLKFKIISAKLQKDYIKDTLVILLEYLGKQDLLPETEFNVQIGAYKLYGIVRPQTKVGDRFELCYTIPDALKLDEKSQIELIVKQMKHPVHIWELPVNVNIYSRVAWYLYLLILLPVLGIVVGIYYLRFYRRRHKN